MLVWAQDVQFWPPSRLSGVDHSRRFCLEGPLSGAGLPWLNMCRDGRDVPQGGFRSFLMRHGFPRP